MGSRLRAGVVACALLLLLTSLPGLARGQDVAAAEDLYNRGVADFRAGRYDAACSEIGASYRMDPLPGALFTLAACETRLGRVASAAAHYQDFLQLVATMPSDQQAMQAERGQVAAKERAALLAEVPTLKIQIDGRLPQGAVVRRDAAVLDAALLGADLPVDPGEHVIAIEMGGAIEHQQRVFVTKREHRTVSIEAPASPAPPPPEPPNRSPAPQPSADRASSSSVGHAQASPTTVGLVAGAFFATAGIAGGSIAGALAIGEKNTVDRECNGAACSAAGKQAADVGRTEAVVSTIAFGVGVAGVAGLAVLLFSGRKGAHSASSVVVSDAGLGLRF